MTLWDNHTAAQATQGTAQGGAWQAVRVEIDSRKVQPGDLFVAISGERFDGHDFVEAAFKNGAVAAIVTRPVSTSGNYVVVDDTLKALEHMAHAARSRTRARVVGVTGSVGKTSTKEMLRLALSAHGRVFATSGNYNNHIGTPLNLANLPADMDFAVFEMGMNHEGEISHLTAMVKPHVAVITTIAAVHMEYFSSLEAIARAKAEIFEGVGKGGVAVLGSGHACMQVLTDAASRAGILNVLTCGEGANDACRILSYQPDMNGCMVRTQLPDGSNVEYRLGASGRHIAALSALVLAVSQALGLDTKRTAQALAQYKEVAGRGQVKRMSVAGGEILFIDDSYNASPVAMRAAFSKLREVWEAHGRTGRMLAALGDMLELGEQSGALHAGLAEDISKQGIHGVFTAGAFMRSLHDALPQGVKLQHTGCAADLLPLLKSHLRSGDVLLMKGSHGSRMYELAESLTKSMEKQDVI